jgi:gliding motility-associated-like protein
VKLFPAYLKTLLLIFVTGFCSAQTFLNGSFEVTTSGPGDAINLSNAGFNGFMANTNAYGTTGNMDIIQSGTWGGGGAQHCKWYVALTGSGTDAITMRLSAALVTGTTYTISYWDRKDPGFVGFPIQIGLSTVNNAFGTVIYTAPVAPTNNVWTQRTFTFVAPNNGQYVSVIQNGGNTGSWVHIDNFVLNNASSSGSLNIAASTTTICVGSSAIFTVTGASTYTWNPSATLSSANASVVTATPPSTTTYTVNGSAGGCLYTASITLNVIPPPAVTVSPVTSGICPGQSVTLTATGSTTYSWTPATALSTTTGSTTIASPSTATNYTVIGGAGSCTSSAVASVTMNPGPILTASNQTICAGAIANCTVTGAVSYTWQPGNLNGVSINVSPAATTVYTVTGTNASGCTSSTTMQVIVNPIPNPIVGSNSPVCVNAPLNLTASGGSTYLWSGPNSFTSSLQNPTIANAAIANAGVYSVTVTSLGCSQAGTVNVIVTTPTTSAFNTGTYCAGASMSFNAPVATSYTWTGPSGVFSNAQSPTIVNSTTLMSGTYTVNVSYGASCTASATTSATVFALPTPTAQSNSPICEGQTLSFSCTPYPNISWSGPGGFSSTQQFPSILICPLPGAGPYTVTVTDANGCINFAIANAVVNPTPNIAVNSPSVCVNQIINLTSNGGSTYLWSGPNSFTSNLQNPSITSATTTMTGAYNLTVTTAAGCSNTAVSNVMVYPLPNPNIVSNDPICVGGTLNLQGSGGANYAWSGPGYTGPSQNPTINNVSVSDGGVYTLLVSSGTCTASINYTVVVNPLPVFNFSNSNVLCNGQTNGTSTVNVTVGTSPYNYQWSNSQTTQAAIGLIAGTYTCIVTDSNNCTSVASTQITEPTAFTVTINSSTVSACAGTPINVTAIGNGGTGPYNYNWVSGPSASLYPVNEAVAGNYSYTVNAVDAYNCPASDIISLTFFAQPTVTATSDTICSGETAQLTANGASTYVWQPGNIVGSTYPYSGTTNINVSVVGTANGCSNSANAAIVVNPLPSGNFNTSGNNGCVPTCITFIGSGSPNVVNYGWTVNGSGIAGSSASESYCFSESGTYSVGLTVMDNNGCVSTSPPIAITMYPQPVADFNHAPLKPIINIDQEVTFTDASWGTPIVSWNWYFMNTAQYTSVLQNPTFNYTEPGTYAVALVVKSDKGCMDTLIRPLVVGEDYGIYVPNAFTPNGDGLNDVFHPKGFGITKYELNIYDRWGELMFHTTTFEEGWNGAKQKKADVSYPLIIEEGTYTWLINCTNVFGKSHELKGHVVLIK